MSTIEAQHKTSIQVSSRARPILIVGLVDSVFPQFLLGSKQWVGPKGHICFIQNLEENGYCCQALCLESWDLADDELLKINTARQGRNRASQAPIEILGATNKTNLTESPFVKYLLYIGANNVRYWNRFNMSLRYEDVVDCLQVLIGV